MSSLNAVPPLAAGLFPVLVAVAAGAVIPFQAGANAMLGRSLGHPLWATVASLLVSLAVVLPVLPCSRRPCRRWRPPRAARPGCGPAAWRGCSISRRR